MAYGDDVIRTNTMTINGAVNDIFRTDIAGDRIFADGFD